MTQTINLISHSVGVGNLRPGYQQGGVLVRTVFLVYRDDHLTASTHGRRRMKRGF